MNKEQFENSQHLVLDPFSTAQEVYNAAAQLSFHAHAGQKYGERPYTYHLKNVEEMFLQTLNKKEIESAIISTGYLGIYSYDEIVKLLQAACLLHDVVEDTWVTQDYLYSSHYPELLRGVVGDMTKVEGETLMMYLEKVMDNEFAHIIKNADSLSNLQCSISSKRVRGVDKYTTVLRYLNGTQDKNGQLLNK